MIQIQLFCSILRKSGIGVVLFSFLMSAVPSSAQKVEIESVIPAYSAAYVSVRDIPGVWNSLKGLPSWRSLLSSVGLADETQEMEAVVDVTTGFPGADPGTLVEAFGRRVALVQVYPFTIDGSGLPAMVADMGDPERGAEALRKIEQRLSSSDEYEVRSPDGKYKTVSFASIRSIERNLIIRYAFLDNLFVLALDQDTFEAILDVYLGEDPSLVYDPKFNDTRAGVSTDGEVFAYVNMELVLPIAWQMWHPGQSMLLQLLGVDKIKSAAWTMALLSPNRNQELYMYTGDSPSLIASLLAEQRPLSSPHLIPIADADIFIAMNLGDLTAAWDKLMDSVRSVMGDEDYALVQSEFTRFEQETALNLKDDILSSLTGEVGFAMPVQGIRDFGTMKDSLLLFCGVKDSERCAVSIGRILSQRGDQVQQMEYGGVMVYLLDGSVNPPGYMFADDLLVFARIQSLKHIIDGELPLAVSEKFAWIDSRFSQRPGFMYYIDLEKLRELLLTVSFMAEPGDDLSDPQKLGSTGGMLTFDGEGLRVSSIGTPGVSCIETIGDLLELFVLLGKYY